MVLDCRCKGISSTHTRAAQTAALETRDESLSGEKLYAKALARKRADLSARKTGAEDYNGDGFVCGRCREHFTAAACETVACMTGPAPAPIIMTPLGGILLTGQSCPSQPA